VVTGETFVPGSPWLATVPALAVVGAAAGAVMSRPTRWWLAPRAAYRRLIFVAVGIVSLPMFVAVGQLREMDALGVPLVFLGAATTTVVYWRALRTARAQMQDRYPRPVVR
jgi:hypothetical protein